MGSKTTLSVAVVGCDGGNDLSTDDKVHLVSWGLGGRLCRRSCETCVTLSWHPEMVWPRWAVCGFKIEQPPWDGRGQERSCCSVPGKYITHYIIIRAKGQWITHEIIMSEWVTWAAGTGWAMPFFLSRCLVPKLLLGTLVTFHSNFFTQPNTSVCDRVQNRYHTKRGRVRSTQPQSPC